MTYPQQGGTTETEKPLLMLDASRGASSNHHQQTRRKGLDGTVTLAVPTVKPSFFKETLTMKSIVYKIQHHMFKYHLRNRATMQAVMSVGGVA